MADILRSIRDVLMPGGDEATNLASISHTSKPTRGTSNQPMTSPQSSTESIFVMLQSLKGHIGIAQVPNLSLSLNAKVQEQLKELREQSDKALCASSTLPFSSSSFIKGRVGHVPPVAIEDDKSVRDHCLVRRAYLSFVSNCFCQLQKGTNAGSQASAANKTVPQRAVPARGRARGSCSTEKTKKTQCSQASAANKTVSHRAVPAEEGGARSSRSTEKIKQTQFDYEIFAKFPLTPGALYKIFEENILSEKELKDNGYPHEDPKNEGKAVIYKYYRKPPVFQNKFERCCSRCTKTYCVGSDGLQVIPEVCVYHWGKVCKKKVSHRSVRLYSCCNSPPSSPPCTKARCHVSEWYDENSLLGFLRTSPSSEKPDDGNYGVYALDCEMCYTVSGRELIRVTVVDTKFEIVYDTLVKPTNQIIDYNTRFSGIEEGDLEDIETTLYDVQCHLLNFISAETILVGHSLENDLMALKICHKNVVDTSIVFPHNLGPPWKQALKNLARDRLQKEIQCGEHDSAEDARACMDLMLRKIHWL